MLKLFNTLSRQIEEFKPINTPYVGMYTCGPTVYDYMHIGNLRTFITSDVLLRVLQINGYKVKFVRNITDIEDKIIKKARERNETIGELTNEYTRLFFEDQINLNILPADVSPKPTEHITKIIKYIEQLIDRGLAYQMEDGSVYFDISKFPEYGKLSQIEKRELKTGTRVLSDEYTKDNIQDFALWKSAQPQEVGFDSPWGWGTPGWHIECSVMSQEYLGDTFDIHVGGIDLLFPHHENEIAQSEGKTGKKFVNYFVHAEHLLVDGSKMSKSLKNFYTLRDIEERGFESLSFRYLTLTAHYKDRINFTWESLQSAQNALNNLRNAVRDWENPGEINQGYWEKFLDSVNNDLNTPKALAIVWEMVHSDIPSAEKSTTILEMDKVLGLGLDEYVAKPLVVPEGVKKLVEEREEVRRMKNFTKSDEIREKINQLGYEVEDTPQGPRIKQIS